MRKITDKAARAFMTGEAFKGDNTAVYTDGEDVCLALHGHVIARRRMYRGLSLQVSLCGWGTATTRERLNGILPAALGVGQTKGAQVWRGRGIWAAYNEQPLDPSTVYLLNLETGTITATARGEA